MDLTKMEDRLDQQYYKNFDKFKSDFQLIVNNCRLYNGVENGMFSNKYLYYFFWY